MSRARPQAGPGPREEVVMPSRNCDTCGKQKDIAGGKTCETGHFMCKACYDASAGVFSGPRKDCPLCKKPLR
jgi:hypothetical protein